MPDVLPDGWEAVTTDDGEVYYWNETTDETCWTQPGLPPQRAP